MTTKIKILKAKISRLRVTGSDKEYEGSVYLCPQLMEQAGIVELECVDIKNQTNGENWQTYAMRGCPGECRLAGGAAHHGKAGDIVHVLAWQYVTPDVAEYRKEHVRTIYADSR